MAVETRFIVVRNGVEMETFTDKKAADEYDRMLDMAEALSELLAQSALTLSDQDKEELGVFLAKNKAPLLAILQNKKPLQPANKKSSKTSAKTSE